MKYKVSLLLLMACLPIMSYPQVFYPDVPDTITGQQARASYMALHYWDKVDFSDTTLLKEPKVVLDFVFLLQLLPSEVASESFKTTFNKLSSHSSNKQLMLFWLDRYLHDSRSPFYNDNLYLKVLDALIASDENDAYRSGVQSMVTQVQRNRIGCPAENFSFVCKDGNATQLYDIETPWLLLIFNSPDCSLCHNLEMLISENDTLQQLINNQQMKVLAICPLADYKGWMSHEYPNNWICGFDKDMTIIKQRLYEIQRFPSIYLLDRDKHVIQKESDYERLVLRFPSNRLE